MPARRTRKVSTTIASRFPLFPNFEHGGGYVSEGITRKRALVGNSLNDKQ